MSVLAEAISLKLNEKGIQHALRGDDNEAVLMVQRLEQTKVTMNVLFLTDDSNHAVAMKFFNFCKLNVRDITDELYYKLNDFNKMYNWGKVVLDNNEIIISMDAVVSPINVGDICLQMTMFAAQIADRVYSAIQAMEYQI